SRQVELAVLRYRGAGLVHELSLLHQIREDCLLPWHCAATRAARPVQAEGGPLSRYPRGRPPRRGAVHLLGEAGQRTARRKDVGSGDHLAFAAAISDTVPQTAGSDLPG